MRNSLIILSIKQHIPNTFTLLNLVCGCIGIIVVFETRQFNYAVWLICLAGGFDFLDGFVARLLKVQSTIGKELDSLADMVTFGILPTIVVYALLDDLNAPFPFKYISLIIAVCSALRLAKFNTDTRQSTSFLGVPTPANAFFISGLPAMMLTERSVVFSYISPVTLTVLMTLTFSLLMVIELPMLALKFSGFGLKENKWKYGLLSISVVLLIGLKLKALPIIIVVYVVLSLIHNLVVKKKEVDAS